MIIYLKSGNLVSSMSHNLCLIISVDYAGFKKKLSNECAINVTEVFTCFPDANFGVLKCKFSTIFSKFEL